MRRGVCSALLASIALFAPLASGAADGVKLVVRANKSVVAPHEPVIVNYDLENVSEDPQDVPAHIDFATGWVKFEISDETGTFRPYHTGIQGATAWESVTLKPGERLSGQVIVLTNAIGRAASSNPTDFGDVPVFPFGKPGRYKIKVTFPLERGSGSDSRRQLVEDLRITVKESTSASEDLERFADVDDLAAAVGADDALVGFAEAEIELGNYTGATNALNRVLSEYASGNAIRLATRLRDGLAKGIRSLREIYSQ